MFDITRFVPRKSFYTKDRELYSYLMLWNNSVTEDKSLLAKDIMVYLQGTYPEYNPYALLQLHVNFLTREQICTFKSELANAPMGLVVPMYPLAA